VNVLQDGERMEAMLKLTRGVRKVPVIVKDGRVEIGYGGT
jgi:glutaredoxin